MELLFLIVWSNSDGCPFSAVLTFMSSQMLALTFIFFILLYIAWILAPLRHKAFLKTLFVSLTGIADWFDFAWTVFRVWILLTIGLAVLTFVAYIPQSVVDVSKSSITCLDGTSYGLETLGLVDYYYGLEPVKYYGPKATMLKGKDAEKAAELCTKHQVFSEEIKEKIKRARSLGMPEELIQNFATRDQLTMNEGPLYTINFVTKTITIGDWAKPILLFASVVLVGLLVGLTVLAFAMELPNFISRKIKEIFGRR